jgi:outer membrane protein TolC
VIARRGTAVASVVLAVAWLGPVPTGAQEATHYRLTLGDAARLAGQRATPVLEARARAEAAEARARQSTADLLPSLDADVSTGGRTFNTASFGLDFPTPPGQAPFFDPDGEVVGPVKSADIRASAEVPLLDLPALARRRSARAGADAERLAERSAASRAAAAAARAYVATLRARAEVEAREADLELAHDLLEIARGLLAAGVGVAIDVTRAEAQAATIRAQLLAGQNRSDIAELGLRRALRLSPEDDLELLDALDALGVGEVPPADEAVARALESRTDLDVTAAYRLAAEESLSATQAGRLPRVVARVDEGFYGKQFGGNLLNTYTWSLRLTVPVFDGFQRSGRAEEQRARMRELDYQLEALREDVDFQVRQALLNLTAAQEQSVAAEERRRLAQLEVDQEEERVRAGVAGTADVVRAAMRLNEARTALLDTQMAVQTSRVSLAEAMGAIGQLP